MPTTLQNFRGVNFLSIDNLGRLKCDSNENLVMVSFALLDRTRNRELDIDFQKIPNFNSLLMTLWHIADFYSLKNVSYFCVEDSKSKVVEPIVLSTYDMRWQNFYRNNDLYLHDPVLYQTFFNILPTDWCDFDISKHKVKNVISIAQDFNIGTFGLSIPVRGPKAERAVISFTSDTNKHDWELFKSDNLKELIILSQLIHQKALKLQLIKTGKGYSTEINITQRELECLYWASQGKTVFETSIIMGISKNTVRAYIESARHSLNCVSITQAVSKAIHLNLMPIYLKTRR